MDNMNSIWLVGAGKMAQDYIRVLDGLGRRYTVIGRGEKSAQACQAATGCEVRVGGLNVFLCETPTICSHAIVSVGVEKLYETTQQLITYGVKNILVEKPGALRIGEFESLARAASEYNANVYIAYNRRFYASVLKAQELIEGEGGVISFNFEFTEWSHLIEPLEKESCVKERWFLANSTHVVDLSFYLGGRPEKLFAFTAGKLDWHPTSSVFSGAGISRSGSLFSYQANWESAGRWSLEIMTRAHRLVLTPLEKLQIQKIGTIKLENVEIDDSLDVQYKPGLYIQTQSFLEYNTHRFCSIQEQLEMVDTYNEIANYR